jgi:lipopolysaccharide transport system permease protein
MKPIRRKRYFADFLLAMTEKEIKARYKHAVLGFMWVVLNPLLQMIVIGIVFNFFVPVSVDNYFLFLFTGLLPWNFFSLSLSKTTPALVYERTLIKKAKFPREAIVLSIVLSNLFHLLISLSMLLVVFIINAIFIDISFAELITQALRFLWLVPLLVWLCVLTSSLSLLFAALNVKYRDINFVVQAILPLWFYVTPIVYTLDLLPSHLHRWFYLNPVTTIINSFQWIFLGVSMPTMEQIAISLMVTVGAGVAGYVVFNNESKFFDDWL